MEIKTKHSWTRSLLWIGIAVLFYVYQTWAQNEAIHKSVEIAESDFHLVELYTSQGCSSCPHADETLREIVQISDSLQSGLVGISMHVDYWNYLGWKDPYSKRQYSKRQSKYQQSIGFKNRYTPQAIINGRFECLGSDADCIKSAIQQSPQPQDLLKSTQVKFSSTLVDVTHLDNLNYSVNYALIQKNDSRDVTSGENQGKTLYNYNIVRKLKTTPMMTGGVRELISIPHYLMNQEIILGIWLEDDQGHVVAGRQWKSKLQ